MNDTLTGKLPRLRQIVEQGPTPLFATVGGAHLLGFIVRARMELGRG